jgi:secondary thiamine-phosphate synthase enzyme
VRLGSRHDAARRDTGVFRNVYSQCAAVEFATKERDSVQPLSNEAETPVVASSSLNGSGHSKEQVTTGTTAECEILSVEHLTPCIARRTIELVTERAFHVTDVTDECLELLSSSGVMEGSLSVYCSHTTCAVKINELETCFLEDLRLFMEKLVPPGAYYRHDDFEMRDPATLAGTPEDEPINGHSHVKQMLLGSASETVPIVAGRLALGRWQRIMFIELDQSRSRRIHIQVQGWR